jgi:hypothetical protein
MGGFGTQLIASRFDFDRGKEAMLIGTVVGAGLGFGVSTWWQFTHWLDQPVAHFGIVNSLLGGMLGGGLVDSFSTDSTAVAWGAFTGMELAGWLTVGLGGGEFALADGLFMASGAGWAAAYTALIIATAWTSSGTPPATKAAVDTLLITPGLGAIALAVAALQMDPSASQILRADAAGAGAGGVLLLIAGLLLGFDTPTPYVLAMLGSAGAIAAISIFWEEAAERPGAPPGPLKLRRNPLLKDPKSGRPYNNPWW